MSKPRKKIGRDTPSQDDPVDIAGAWPGPPIGPAEPHFGPESAVHKAREKGQTPNLGKEKNG